MENVTEWKGSGDEPWKCPFCEKSCPRRDHLKYHLDICPSREMAQESIQEHGIRGILTPSRLMSFFLISLGSSIPQIPFISGLCEGLETGNNTTTAQGETSKS